jgi:hypothetical protein
MPGAIFLASVIFDALAAACQRSLDKAIDARKALSRMFRGRDSRRGIATPIGTMTGWLFEVG